MIELLNCDCMEYMATLPDNAFDLAIVDPPYGINIGKQSQGKGGKRTGKYARNYKKVHGTPVRLKKNILMSYIGLAKIKLSGEQTISLSILKHLQDGFFGIKAKDLIKRMENWLIVQ